MAFHVSLSVEASFSVDLPLYVRVIMLGGLSGVRVGEEGGCFYFLLFCEEMRLFFCRSLLL